MRNGTTLNVVTPVTPNQPMSAIGTNGHSIHASQCPLSGGKATDAVIEMRKTLRATRL
jgi:hypothetical protein